LNLAFLAIKPTHKENLQQQSIELYKSNGFRAIVKSKKRNVAPSSILLFS
jgi:hypothetical protein